MLIEVLSVYVNYLWRQTLTWELSDYNTLSRSCFHSDDNTTGVKKKKEQLCLYLIRKYLTCEHT